MKVNTSHIVFVLDRSGSMEDMLTEAVVSYNRFVEEQKAVPQEASFHAILFNVVAENLYQGRMADTPALTAARYAPTNGTALYDAMGDAIEHTGKKLAAMPEEDRPEHVIVAVMTDGLENSSRRTSKYELAQMIAHQQEAYNWQFIFLGANMDAAAEAVALNIPVANATQWEATPEGVTMAFSKNSRTVTRFRTGK